MMDQIPLSVLFFLKVQGIVSRRTMRALCGAGLSRWWNPGGIMNDVQNVPVVAIRLLCYPAFLFHVNRNGSRSTIAMTIQNCPKMVSRFTLLSV